MTDKERPRDATPSQDTAHGSKRTTIPASEVGVTLTIGVLMESLHLGDGIDRKRDLSDLAGTWSDEEAKEFEANTRVFEQIDDEMWTR